MKALLELGMVLYIPMALILTLGIAEGMGAGDISLIGGTLAAICTWLPAYGIGYVTYRKEAENRGKENQPKI